MSLDIIVSYFLQFEGTTEVFVAVRPYKTHGQHPYLTQVSLVEDTNLPHIWIQNEHIVDQVFLVEDRTMPMNRGKCLVLKKAKFWVADSEFASHEDRDRSAQE